ncbi:MULTISPECIES: PTS mannitol transporter subunit IICBA [unclassified Streptococcus]|uniref:PTS mannitol transporter subunit IICBA n=1 Tax=unclassified Streptococcus TaxID=2608887 RepID=UPI001072DEAF|nr:MULTISPECIES: PTS mannitol transporter subunit IICBA [unclassified Streptococcus]MBF0786327.1 PTS mannitol transporter subunit IICBA [Streptococcus sp. 19428wC2_LYSM12]MCQ9212436.1 PTS mannitol transporter subunit IICBA [Streptococcus sp. B01]MCQ9213774.1 PTS mannitol transporter subunit IICBA [Streptococcus sp. O1]TFV06738.1 PTS mannitol transporter subunit IICBA [Streptococcus sp. LYSM12]
MENSSLRVRIQKLGTTLSNMVMPNIGSFIAWGVLTSLFIEKGWLPNDEFATIVVPMITYLLPLLIGYTGGYNVYGQRGGVVGAILTMGVIAGSEVPMFIGAMLVGPFGAWVIKKFDQAFQEKIRPGFEMLVNNFSAGLIGFALMLVSFKVVGPFVSNMTSAIGGGVQAIVDMRLLPLANIIIEPAKVLFLNNALNHGIFTPLGTEQVLKVGKSVLFLLEANPGPGLGILFAYALFGKGSAKSSSWGAMIIHFFGGIHEIYFPYVMMKPALFLAAIAGGVSGTFTFQLLNAGLVGASSPGSIIAITGLVPKEGNYFANLLAVWGGVFAGALASFLVASLVLKADKSESASLESAQAATKAAKAVAKGQAQVALSEDMTVDTVHQIIFACDAGMGSSAMGASLLRDKVKKAGLNIPVTNKAIANLQDTDHTLIITQEELAVRAAQRTPRAIHIAVDNFLTSPKYDDIIAQLTQQTATVAPTQVEARGGEGTPDLNGVDRVIFAYGEAQGSATMGQATLSAIFKNKGIKIPVISVPYTDLSRYNAETSLIVTTLTQQATVQGVVPKATIMAVDSLVTTPEYDKLVATIHK